jgi:hypothetical protein
MSVLAGKYNILLKTGNALGVSADEKYGNYCCVSLNAVVWTVTPVEGTNIFYLSYIIQQNEILIDGTSARFNGDRNTITLDSLYNPREPEYAMILNDVGDGWVAINNHDETLVFDAQGDHPELGASVQGWKWNKGDNQRWKFVPVSIV